MVFWLSDGLPNIGLVFDRMQDGRLLIIHNIDAGAQLVDVMFAFRVTAYYRFLPAA